MVTLRSSCNSLLLKVYSANFPASSGCDQRSGGVLGNWAKESTPRGDACTCQLKRSGWINAVCGFASPEPLRTKPYAKWASFKIRKVAYQRFVFNKRIIGFVEEPPFPRIVLE